MTAPISQKDFPMLTDMATLSVVEGGNEFFRNGTVRLGGTDIPWHSDLVGYEFSGGKADRGKDGVLAISTSDGARSCYRYDRTKENWFRRLEVETPAHFAQLWRAEANESIAKYGIVFGSAIYATTFLVFKMAATYAFVMCVWLLIFVLASPERPLPNMPVQVVKATLLEGLGATLLFVLHYVTTHRHLGVRELLLSAYWSVAALWPVYVSALVLAISAAW